MAGTAIGKKYKKQIARGKPQDYICKHRRLGHHLERVAPPADPGTMTAIKEERHRKTVEERIDELYALSLAGSKLAIKKGEPDIRGLAACIAQGIAATALMGKATEKDDDTPGIDRAIAEMKARRDGKRVL